MKHRIRALMAGVTSLLVVAACGPAATPSSAPTSPPAAANPTAAPTRASAGAQVSGALEGVPTPQSSPVAKGAQVAAPKQYSAPPAMEIDQSKSYTAVIETSQGTMQAELFDDDVPLTVNNFVFLARQGFYDGVTFHRVIKDFMIQTGDPTGTGTGSPGYRFNDEPVTRQYERGTLAMANSGPNTNGSQFFIVHKDYPLPPNYTIFGKVTDGLDTLDAIATTPTGPGRGGSDTPKAEITIESITINEE